jgi:hypothetical protein
MLRLCQYVSTNHPGLSDATNPFLLPRWVACFSITCLGASRCSMSTVHWCALVKKSKTQPLRRGGDGVHGAFTLHFGVAAAQKVLLS